jgi:hypothetical protein
MTGAQQLPIRNAETHRSCRAWNHVFAPAPTLEALANEAE